MKKCKELIEVFGEKEIEEFVIAYEDFRKDEVVRLKYYEEFLQEAAEIFNEKIKTDELKLLVYTTMSQLNADLKQDLRDVDMRQKLINDIGKQIFSAFTEMKDSFECQKTAICFLPMRIISDMCFAWGISEESGTTSELQLSAMFYDLMCKWNESEEIPDQFKEFYGEAALEDIRNRSLEIVKLYCERKGVDLTTWYGTQSVKEKEYVQNFTEMLAEESEKQMTEFSNRNKKFRREKSQKRETKDGLQGREKREIQDELQGREKRETQERSQETEKREIQDKPQKRQKNGLRNETKMNPEDEDTDKSWEVNEERSWKERKKETEFSERRMRSQMSDFSWKKFGITIIVVLVLIVIIIGAALYLL